MAYQYPVHSIRPSKSHRFDFYSPKLGRPITLFSYPQLNQWSLLEAFPAVKTFCERPDTLELQDGKQLVIDFWIQKNRNEAFIVIIKDKSPILRVTGRPTYRVTFVSQKSLGRWAIFADNWQSMLPYIVSHRKWCGDAETKLVASFVKRPMTLKELENQMSAQDSSFVRACVFRAIAQGQLRAPSLKQSLWQQRLLILPGSPTHDH